MHDKPSRFRALEAMRTLIAYIGDDPNREGVQDTPDRVLRAWEEDWGAGYATRTPDDLLKLFTDGAASARSSEMVIVRDINFFSTCEHHLAPFFGVAHVAYIPDQRGIVGLSKLARVVEHFARRLQVQERLTTEIAEFLRAHLSSDIGIMLSATHLCMVSRGVRQPNARTITTALRGEFMDEREVRSEFLSACR